ncbi:hypothetical protein L9F63_019337, partial [Diploptera punctata]
NARYLIHKRKLISTTPPLVIHSSRCWSIYSPLVTRLLNNCSLSYLSMFTLRPQILSRIAFTTVRVVA